MAEQSKEAIEAAQRLGTRASVICDPYTHGPAVIAGGQGGRGLRSLEDEIERLQEAGYGHDLIDEFPIVSCYSLHVALYALQNPTPENIERALEKIGVSGDCEECVDDDTLRPLPVPPPHSWSEDG